MQWILHGDTMLATLFLHHYCIVLPASLKPYLAILAKLHSWHGKCPRCVSSLLPASLVIAQSWQQLITLIHGTVFDAEDNPDMEASTGGCSDFAVDASTSPSRSTPTPETLTSSGTHFDAVVVSAA